MARKIKSPGRLSNAIDKMEMEEVDNGVKVTIHYQHHYLEDPEQIKAEVFLSKAAVEAQHGFSPSITSYMHEIGVMLGLEDKGKTVDWQLTREIPDEYLAQHPECTESNPFAVAQAPGRSFWLATGYR